FIVSTCDCCLCIFFFSSRRRHTRCYRDWSSDVCSSDLAGGLQQPRQVVGGDGQEAVLVGVDQLASFDALAEDFDRATPAYGRDEIGRASCRERGEGWVVGGVVREEEGRSNVT